MRSLEAGRILKNVIAAGALTTSAVLLSSPSAENHTIFAQSDSNPSPSENEHTIFVGSDVNKVRPTATPGLEKPVLPTPTPIFRPSAPNEAAPIDSMTDEALDAWFAAQEQRPRDYIMVNNAQDYDDQTKLTPLDPTSNTPTR